MREPELFERLMRLLTEATVTYLVGADRGRCRSCDAVRHLGRHAVARGSSAEHVIEPTRDHRQRG